MSDGNSILYRRIIWAYFRTCSTCWSRSQALFYLYAQCTIADRAESTFALLRYFLGGNRPSQTDPQALSLAWLTGIEVRIPEVKGWYFTG